MRVPTRNVLTKLSSFLKEGAVHDDSPETAHSQAAEMDADAQAGTTVVAPRWVDADRVPRDAVYPSGREPAMRISTSLLALCCQSAPEPTCDTPIRARSRSDASRSLRRSPLFLARFTSPSSAPWIRSRELS